MNKNRGLTPLAVVLMLSGSLALTGCDDKQDQQGGQQMPEVGVVTLKTEPLQITTELPGRTVAYRIAEVRPQVSGIILKRNFVEGSDIEAGVSLYQIDPATYQATYDSAKGDLAKAQAAANIAELTVKRYQKLLGTQYISKQEYDQALADAQQATAAVVAAKAAVETARINLAYTKVTSPISGRIGKSSVTEGALVQNGQASALATVQQLDPIYVDVTQSSNDFLRLKQELANGSLKQENGKAKVDLVTSDGIKFPQSGTLEFSDVTVDRPPDLLLCAPSSLTRITPYCQECSFAHVCRKGQNRRHYWFHNRALPVLHAAMPRCWWLALITKWKPAKSSQARRSAISGW